MLWPVEGSTYCSLVKCYFRCGACNRLKEDFKADGEKLKELADSFLMINVGGDDNNKFDVRLPLSRYILNCVSHTGALMQCHWASLSNHA